MRILSKQIATLALAATGVLAASQSHAQLFVTPGGAHDSDGAIDAEASFSLSGNTLTLVLTDLLQNPNSQGEVVSGVNFDVSGTGVGLTLKSGTGALGNIASNGSYTRTGATPNNLSGEWNNFGSSSQPNVNVFNMGTPDYMIIGPDSVGSLMGTAASGGYYTGNGAGITDGHFDPYVLGSATFTFTTTGLSSLSQISNVQIQFGTGPDYYCTTEEMTTPVPEPATIISGILMLVPLSVGVIRVYSKRSPAQKAA